MSKYSIISICVSKDELEIIYKQYGIEKTGLKGEVLTEEQRQIWLEEVLKKQILKGLNYE